MPNISRAEIKAIISSQKKWYQNIPFGLLLNTHRRWQDYVRRAIRMPQEQIVLRHFPDVRGKRVIDIGCNAGLYSVESSCRGASHVVGVDVNPAAIEQANIVREVYRRQGKPVGEIEFHAGDISESLQLVSDRHVLFACCVLYHLGPVANLSDSIRESSMEKMVIQGNTVRMARIGEKNHPEAPGYEPENQTWGNILSDVAGITSFVERCGFRVADVHHAKSQFPLVISQRNGSAG